MKRTVIHIIALTLAPPLLAVLALFGAGPALAQGPMFKPSQVTEGALIDALGVTPGAATEPPSRSIRMCQADDGSQSGGAGQGQPADHVRHRLGRVDA